MAMLLTVAGSGYLGVGLVFSVWFAWRGAGRLDPAARRGTVGFRFLLIPGAMVLWPFLGLRLARGGPVPPIERNAHRLRARRRAGR